MQLGNIAQLLTYYRCTQAPCVSSDSLIVVSAVVGMVVDSAFSGRSTKFLVHLCQKPGLVKATPGAGIRL